MIYVMKREPKVVLTAFKDMKPGDLFMGDGNLYIKTDGASAFCVNTADVVSFPDGSVCFPMCGAQLKWWLEEGDRND